MNDAYHYRSVQGESIDLICHRHYGSVPGVIEQVMEANPELAEAGAIIAENTLIVLPNVTTVASKAPGSVQLWA